MSLTVTTAPSTKQVATRPIIWEVTSDRYSSAVEAVSGVTSGTGAKARYAIATHPYKVGDVLTGSGFSVSSYNVRQSITVVNAAWIETNVDYNGASTGTLTRTNDSFQVKCEVAAFNTSSKNIVGVTDPGIPGFSHIDVIAHGYSIGDIVLIEGTTDYNGAFEILNILTVDGFIIATAFTTSQTGTVRLGDIVASKAQQPIDVSGTILFRFDASNFLRAVLTPDLVSSIGANIVTPNTGTIVKYAVRFTEQYDDRDGLLDDADSLVSVFKQAVRATLQHEETQTLTAYILGSSSKKFLTNAPLVKKIRVGEEEQLSFITDTGVAASETYHIRYQQYDLSGAALAAASLSGIIIVDNRGIAPVNSNIISSSISKVDVWIVDGSNVQLSEKRTFVIDKRNYSQAIRVHFENNKGGWDAYTFTNGYKRFNENSKTSFNRVLPNSFTVKDRGQTTLGVSVEQPYEISTELLSKAEGLWLEELLNATNAFIKNVGDTEFIPINILNSSDKVEDDLEPVQIRLVYKKSNSPIKLSN